MNLFEILDEKITYYEYRYNSENQTAEKVAALDAIVTTANACCYNGLLSKEDFNKIDLRIFHISAPLIINNLK